MSSVECEDRRLIGDAEDGEVEEGEASDVEKPEVKRRRHLCGVCHQNDWQYICPKCRVESCSLQCVTAHKKNNLCDAKRYKVEALDPSQFNDQTLRDDYSLLEALGQHVENAARFDSKIQGLRLALPQEGQKVNRNQLPLKTLRAKALASGVIFRAAPSASTRRLKNTTTVSTGGKKLRWKLDWDIYDNGDNPTSQTDKAVSEDTTLSALIAKKIATPSDWQILLKEEGGPANQRGFYAIQNNSDTLKQALNGLVVVENPRLYLVRRADLHQDSNDEFFTADPLNEAKGPKIGTWQGINVYRKLNPQPFPTTVTAPSVPDDVGLECLTQESSSDEEHQEVLPSTLNLRSSPPPPPPPPPVVPAPSTVLAAPVVATVPTPVNNPAPGVASPVVVRVGSPAFPAQPAWLLEEEELLN